MEKLIHFTDIHNIFWWFCMAFNAIFIFPPLRQWQYAYTSRNQQWHYGLLTNNKQKKTTRITFACVCVCYVILGRKISYANRSNLHFLFSKMIFFSQEHNNIRICCDLKFDFTFAQHVCTHIHMHRERETHSEQNTYSGKIEKEKNWNIFFFFSLLFCWCCCWFFGCLAAHCYWCRMLNLLFFLIADGVLFFSLLLLFNCHFSVNFFFSGCCCCCYCAFRFSNQISNLLIRIPWFFFYFSIWIQNVCCFACVQTKWFFFICYFDVSVLEVLSVW